MPDPFMPIDDQARPPDPGLGQMMAPGQPGMPSPGGAMQQPQSPAEHASLKQDWHDWFHNPATGAFLMQFGMGMLQPNIRGFGAQLGTALGEGGEAVGRMATQKLEQQKAQTEAEKVQQEGEYYKAHARYLPQEGQARLLEARAAWQNALTNIDKLPLEQQKLELQSAYNDAKNQLAASGLSIQEQKIELQRISADYEDKLRQAQTQLAQTKAVDPLKEIRLNKYLTDMNNFNSDITGTLKEPDYKKYGLTAADVGDVSAAQTTGAAPTTGTPATTGTPPTTGARPDFSTIPPYQDTPGSRAMLDKLIRSDPAALEQVGAAWMRQGMTPMQWEQIKDAARQRTQAK